jgi:hypothetical protein
LLFRAAPAAAHPAIGLIWKPPMPVSANAIFSAF